jgi:hypothetical protein
MNLTLTINSQDYGFVIEAIKLRTGSMIEALDVQKERQERAARSESPISAAPVKQEGEGVSFVSAAHPKMKKPHWTQTAKGRKIMAARKTKGTK